MAAAGVTLAYSTHRPETLAPAAALMRGHATIILEEPETPGFHAMLRRELAVDEYLTVTEYEYPAFARRSASLLRELFAEGKYIVQLDPYMDVLVSIHEFFTDGHGPSDIAPKTTQAAVYDVEHRWTKALIHYYEASGQKDFDGLVAALIGFARRDAERGRMRDAMRAEHFARILHKDSSARPGPVYLEAGSIHFSLLRELVRRLDKPPRLVYLMEDVSRRVWGRRQVLGPGDVLTLLLTFFPDRAGPRAELLAAQSLIHVKIQQKEELEECKEEPAPHTVDEAWSAGVSMALGYDECRELYERLKGLPTPHARRLATDYLKHINRRPVGHIA
ncbi:hypothetical protein [Oceanidesulfovibrio marinus]|uniref:Uncharacterized protein n=1 Tax=Oceanidesulfovibrio marinus TaxID=370038 RepID=A0A6P1ZLL5_9BACT|nr:hypothetical protein [Oceanidesulfovibrio marinus]TVM36683.1 hypothetical protein DQK91_01820 [Oceanidesulfovibrio marinus]